MGNWELAVFVVKILCSMYLEKFKKRFIESLVFHKKVAPCTEEEIDFLEQKLGMLLPIAYQEFLLWGGHKAGGLMEGSDCFYRHLLDIQETARLILEDDEFPRSLPEDAFVFFMHHDYQFLFFKTTRDDPEVYGYTEGQAQRNFTRFYYKYTDFLMDYLETLAEFIKKK